MPCYVFQTKCNTYVCDGSSTIAVEAAKTNKKIKQNKNNNNNNKPRTTKQERRRTRKKKKKMPKAFSPRDKSE